MKNKKVFIADANAYCREKLSAELNPVTTARDLQKLVHLWSASSLTLGIYYTNRSPVSTNIWAEFATKLCFFRLVEKIHPTIYTSRYYEAQKTLLWLTTQIKELPADFY